MNKYFIKVIVAGIMALSILSVFAMIYEYRGIRVENETGATDFKFRSKDFKGTMTEGFSWFYEDEDGFNNIKLAEQNTPDILLMGSSHMEARQISPKENVAALLNDMQEDYFAYNIGMSGHSIYRCIDNMENAVNYYCPKKYIILETDKIELDIEEMDMVLSGQAQKVSFYNSGFINTVQKIPAIKLIYTSLSDWISQDKNIESIEDNEENVNLFDITDYSIVLDQFLSKAKLAANGKKIIIFYHPQQKVEWDGTVSYQTDEEYLNIFSEECKNNDIEFIDMTENFKKLYDEEYVLAYGFSNTSVGTGHLNKYGHKMIAEKLSEVINEMEGK